MSPYPKHDFESRRFAGKYKSRVGKSLEFPRKYSELCLWFLLRSRSSMQRRKKNQNLLLEVNREVGRGRDYVSVYVH